MMQRRTDEQTALTAEYALYLVDIRGVEFALDYLDTCNVSRSILTRALQSPDCGATTNGASVRATTDLFHPRPARTASLLFSPVAPTLPHSVIGMTKPEKAGYSCLSSPVRTCR